MPALTWYPDALDDLQPVQFAHRHSYPFCHSHRGLQRRKNGGWLAYDGIKSGHFYAAKSGHYHLAVTRFSVDNLSKVNNSLTHL
jgi:hypothetical protein